MDWMIRFNRIIELIESNAIDITYTELEQISSDTPYFKKMFLELVGVSLYEYLISRKMYYSALAILNGKKPFDLWIRCGYKSYEGFRIAFKKYQGYSPASLKNNTRLIKHIPPIRVTLSVDGGEKVSYHIVNVEESLSLYAREYICPLSESWHTLPGIFLNNKKREETEGRWVSKYVITYEKNDNIHFLIGKLKDSEADPDEHEIVLMYKKYAVFDYHGTYEDSISFRNRIFKDWMVSETRFIPSSYILFEQIKEEENGTFHIAMHIPVRDRREETDSNAEGNRGTIL